MAKIHAIELVAAQNQQVFEIVVQEMDHVLAYRVSGALVPGYVVERLLGREDFDEATRKMVEFVRLGNVPVQRRGIKLREEINTPQSGIHAIGDGNIDQPIFARKRHGRLRPVFRQWKQSCPLPAPHDHGKHIAGVGGHALAI